VASHRRRWNTPTTAGVVAALAVAALLVALVVGAVHHHRSAASSGPPTAAVSSGQPAAIRVYASGTDYRRATLAAGIAALLRTTPTPSATVPAADTPATPGNGGFTLAQLRASRAAMRTCAQVLGGAPGTALIAVDFARFEGKPAALFVLPTAGHPEDVDVWVVKSTCSNASFDYFFRRVAR
jgi:hypothetical protein